MVLTVLGLPVLALATLTVVGARRRGAGIPLVVLSGLFFPAAWVVWYLHDEHPYQRLRP
jgi:hypothetical protein